MRDDSIVTLEARCRYFGERLAERRKKLGLTLEALAKRTQISVGYLNNLERAFQRRPSSPTIPGDERLERLAEGLDVSFIEINSWLNRAPRDFDVAFWDQMVRKGFRRSLSLHIKAKILDYVQSTIAEDVRKSEDADKARKKRMTERFQMDDAIIVDELTTERDVSW